jgi:predicted aspartyl protease
MMSRIPMTIAACCLLAAGTAQSSIPLRSAATVHLVVPALINGQGPFPFILDTGADESGVYKWFAEKQGFAPGPATEIEGMTGKTTNPTYRLDSITVDGRTIRNIVADSFPNRHDVEVEAGAIGNDLMDGSVTIFDFPCKTVEILPKPVDMKRLLTKDAHKVDGGTVVDGTQLSFPVQIGAARGIAVLDTGSSDTRVNTAFVKAAGIDPASGAFRNAEPIFGVNSNPTPSRKGSVGTVRLAGLEIPDAEVRVIDMSVYKSFGFGDGPAMILGLDLMAGYRLVYDHEAKLFWFDRSQCER